MCCFLYSIKRKHRKNAHSKVGILASYIVAVFHVANVIIVTCVLATVKVTSEQQCWLRFVYLECTVETIYMHHLK